MPHSPAEAGVNPPFRFPDRSKWRPYPAHAGVNPTRPARELETRTIGASRSSAAPRPPKGSKFREHSPFRPDRPNRLQNGQKRAKLMPKCRLPPRSGDLTHLRHPGGNRLLPVSESDPGRLKSRADMTIEELHVASGGKPLQHAHLTDLESHTPRTRGESGGHHRTHGRKPAGGGHGNGFKGRPAPSTTRTTEGA